MSANATEVVKGFIEVYINNIMVSLMTMILGLVCLKVDSVWFTAVAYCRLHSRGWVFTHTRIRGDVRVRQKYFTEWEQK